MIDLTGAAGNEEMTDTSSIQMAWNGPWTQLEKQQQWSGNSGEVGGFCRWAVWGWSPLGWGSCGLSVFPVCTDFNKRSAVSWIWPGESLPFSRVWPGEGLGHSDGSEALESLTWLCSCQKYTFMQDFEGCFNIKHFDIVIGLISN